MTDKSFFDTIDETALRKRIVANALECEKLTDLLELILASRGNNGQFPIDNIYVSVDSRDPLKDLPDEDRLVREIARTSARLGLMEDLLETVRTRDAQDKHQSERDAQASAEANDKETN